MKDSTFEELYGRVICEKAKELIVAKKDSSNQHYKNMSLQPIDVMRQWMTKEQMVGFLLGNCLKYLGRFNIECTGKGGINDLLKASEYLEWLIMAERE